MKHSSHTRKTRLAVFSLVALVATFLATGLRLWSMLQYYDAEMGYYVTGAVPPVLSNLVLSVGVLGLLAFAAFGFEKEELTLPLPGIVERSISVLPALLAVAAVFLPALMNTERSISTLVSFDSSLLLRLSDVLAFPFAAFFILIACGLFHREKLRGLLVLTGFLGILYSLIHLAVAYFDFRVRMNAPNKLIFQLACLCLMLFLLAETRIVAGEPKPRFCLFSYGVTALVLGTSAIPSVVAYSVGILPEQYNNLMPDLVCVAVFCYCVVRLTVVGFSLSAREATAKTEALSADSSEKDMQAESDPENASDVQDAKETTMEENGGANSPTEPSDDSTEE